MSLFSPGPPPDTLWSRLRPTVAYWSQTEVHVYGFSIAANVLLSFFPFLIVIFSVCRFTLGWTATVNAIELVLDDYFPGSPGDPNSFLDFIRRNLLATAGSRRALQVGALFLLLFTANGIFEPLEVAFNRVWGIARNRSYLRNQLISLGLIFACGTLALASTVLSGATVKRLGDAPAPARFLEMTVLKAAALPLGMLMLFLIYWLLPNARVRARHVLPAAVVVGLALEALKYLNMLTWPLWRGKLRAEYGPFTYSVTIVLWSFLGALIVLAGAEWAARRHPLSGPPAPQNGLHGEGRIPYT
jgi:YihY family inner membrane protein